jgi:peptidoglycan hydrolase-like protein with peptidoglycan-binding domain
VIAASVIALGGTGALARAQSALGYGRHERSASGGTRSPGAANPARVGGSSAGSSRTSAPRHHPLTRSGRRRMRIRHALRAPQIAKARCVPAGECSTRVHLVAAGGLLRLEGRGLHAGLRVLFPAYPRAKISRSSPRSLLRPSALGLVVQVPRNAHTGKIIVIGPGRLHSNLFGPIYVVDHKLHPPKPKPVPVSTPAPAPAPGPSSAAGTPFAGQGMWIWELARSSGGNVAEIAAQAHAAGITTLFIKSADGTSYWSQFTPQLVAELHAAGLHVCGWQYVYGSNPIGEAEAAAQAAANGAECLVIDAETQYEGRYAAAQRYIETLRAKVGPTYPLGLTSFPYVDYHESLPYSVFLGPGGAQFNLPQMYWKDIGISVSYAYVHTFEENLIYGRPICPLGQTFQNPAAAELISFRSLAVPYQACGGVSFWDWQETTARGWAALAAPLEPSPPIPEPELTSPLLKEGAKGDQVLWLQEHLASAIAGQPTNGIFESVTLANLLAFQSAHGLPASGETEPATWAALLALPPVAVHWTGSGPAG